MAISVNVRLIGIFRVLSGKSRLLVELDEEPAIVGGVIQKLAEVFSPEFKEALIDPELKDPRPNALILVNGKEISVLEGLKTEVNKGDEIVLVPVSHGG
ncbi:MAG: MoaD/ThiS family protein [Candidatus Bathyarchaeota archaeon]|nr:MoaD/ThiS family protein [Candidatus Bathyarchaeota archaeon]MDH5532730.1 MoaD/ThiS family protein [Candidatus Bathyarchaeota archaeon]